MIVDTIEEAMASTTGGRTPRRLADWLDLAPAADRRGELVYLAHQLDFMGRCP